MWDVAMKNDNLWVKWVHEQYLKDCTWWGYYVTGDRCWFWKKLYKVKEKFKLGFSSKWR